MTAFSPDALIFDVDGGAKLFDKHEAIECFMVKQYSNAVVGIDDVPALFDAVVGVVHTFGFDILRA